MDEVPLKDQEEGEMRSAKVSKKEESPVARREEDVLAFWKKEKIFEKSLAKEAPKGDFVFYDGPPFATGLPHYGHILAGTIKDTIPRYKTMRGYRAPRRWGWDCHGLPLENQIEKELGIKTKRDIEELGVGRFNAAARDAVLRYADDWKRIVPRFGRWVDMENDYRTMDASYTESVWWAFKNLYDKNLIYEGFKPMHLCPRCGTTLANFEVAQGYKDITDLAVTVKLRLKDDSNSSLLAWTTTPWTLPGNLAAAVKADAVYVKVKIGNENYILAKERTGILKEPFEVVGEMKGYELIGKSYEPPFPYFEKFPMEGKEKAWKVYGAPYVVLDEGTGIVHLAPAFGAEDLELAQKEGIPILHHVDKDGFFIEAVTDFRGMQAKPKDDPQSTDVAIIKTLAAKGLLFAKEKITHSYPHCWRCETPLLNYATSSWFVEVTKFAPKLVAENKKIGWVPKDVGEKRFGNWLENARDWAISRARYWGAPIPVWRNTKTKEHVVIGSLAELKRYTKKSGNRYFVMRHGESEKNILDILSSSPNDGYHLTEKGKEMARVSARALSVKLDLIISSQLVRAQETAGIVRKECGLAETALREDARLNEHGSGAFDKRPGKEWTARYETCDKRELFEKGIDGSESVRDLQKRLGELLYELERTHSEKNILLVTHGWPAAMLRILAMGVADPFRIVSLLDGEEPGVAEICPLPFVPLPHNEDYGLDVHRPYIDEIKLEQNGAHLERVSDVFDCWFESGSMSYAQNHYPFEHSDVFEPKPGWFSRSRGYPADFIAEGLDQTRGWFYSLLVLGTALFGKAPYRNVIVNGIILAEDGQKMSKRLKNYPDPLDVLEKYGADAIRYYLLASPVVHGEDLNFSEKGVGEAASKLIGRLSNVLSFYELYKDAPHAEAPSEHVLDCWILARLNRASAEVSAGMEAYELDRAARPLMEFVDDFSTWYLRRSRERFKEEGADAAFALETTRFVLETFSKLAAPFVPFVAEYVYRRVRGADAAESVHLCEWPTLDVQSRDDELLEDMKEARRLVTLGLEARQKANIKVRQPLKTLAVGSKRLAEKPEFLNLVRDEVNVKDVETEPALLPHEVKLDTEMTDELREEGELRDLIRAVQDLRKDAGLLPKTGAVLVASPNDMPRAEKHREALMKAANLLRIEAGETTHVSKP